MKKPVIHALIIAALSTALSTPAFAMDTPKPDPKEPEKKDSVGQIFANIPSIDTKKVTTQVLCDNGDTIVLGGIFEQTTRTTVEKVPLLGDIPVVGWLFKRTIRVDDKTELLIFVTPKIVKDTLTVR